MEHREWESIPNAALVNIFCRTSIKDRIYTTPFISKSWYQASRHPQCWASMLPQSYFATDDAFLKDSHPYQHSLIDPFDGKHKGNITTGFNAFKSLCRRAGNGGYITSLYIYPFLNFLSGVQANDDFILDFIAQHCPNLKHLSFHGSQSASVKAIQKVIRNCTKLELVDFSDSPYFCYSVLENLSICCPNIRGIRRNGYVELHFASHLNKLFPSLRLLDLSNSTISDKDLLTLVSEFKGPLYIDIRHCNFLVYYMQIIKVSSSSASNIEIIYD